MKDNLTVIFGSLYIVIGLIGWCIMLYNNDSQIKSSIILTLIAIIPSLIYAMIFIFSEEDVSTGKACFLSGVFGWLFCLITILLSFNMGNYTIALILLFYFTGLVIFGSLIFYRTKEYF